MAAKKLVATEHQRIASAYSYPDGAHVLVLQNESGERHIIFADTNVSALLTATDGTGFGNAPVGTVIIQSIAGAAQIHIKETDATWTSK